MTTENDTFIEDMAVLEFEPWVPGLEVEMTPANLMDSASSGPFLAAYCAYKSMFRGKSELVELYASDHGLENAEALLAYLNDGAEWFEKIAALMRSAQARHISAAATASLREAVQ